MKEVTQMDEMQEPIFITPEMMALMQQPQIVNSGVNQFQPSAGIEQAQNSIAGNNDLLSALVLGQSKLRRGKQSKLTPILAAMMMGALAGGVLWGGKGAALGATGGTGLGFGIANSANAGNAPMGFNPYSGMQQNQLTPQQQQVQQMLGGMSARDFNDFSQRVIPLLKQQGDTAKQQAGIESDATGQEKSFYEIEDKRQDIATKQKQQQSREKLAGMFEGMPTVKEGILSGDADITKMAVETRISEDKIKQYQSAKEQYKKAKGRSLTSEEELTLALKYLDPKTAKDIYSALDLSKSRENLAQYRKGMLGVAQQNANTNAAKASSYINRNNVLNANTKAGGALTKEQQTAKQVYNQMLKANPKVETEAIKQANMLIKGGDYTGGVAVLKKSMKDVSDGVNLTPAQELRKKSKSAGQKYAEKWGK